MLPPLPGTLPEPQIYGRLARALNLMPANEVLEDLAAKAGDIRAFGVAFAAAVAADRNVGRLGGQVLYETLGRALPDGTAAAALQAAGQGRVASNRAGQLQDLPAAASIMQAHRKSPAREPQERRVAI